MNENKYSFDWQSNGQMNLNGVKWLISLLYKVMMI